MAAIPARLAHLNPEHTVRFLGHDTHTHDCPHLIYVVAGRARVTIDGTPTALRARESVWLRPHVPHSARYESGSLVLGPFLSASTVPTGRWQRLGVLPALAAVITALLGCPPTTAAEVAVFRAEMDTILTGLTTNRFEVRTPTHPVVAALAERAKFSDQSLEELASTFGISARQVQRIFLAETGVSFRRWRARTRLNSAAARLDAGEAAATVARAAGYSSASGLRRAIARESQ